MRFRIYISLSVALFIGMLYWACGDSNRTLSPSSSGESILELIDYKSVETLTPTDYAALHTEILNRFSDHHSLLGGEKIHARDLVPMFTRIANEALEQRGIEPIITERDVTDMLSHFKQLREAGAVDFFNLASEIPVGAFAYFVERKQLNSDAAAQYVRTLVKLRNNEDSRDEKENPLAREFYECTTDDPMRDEIFVSMVSSSYAFWSDLHLSSPADTIPGNWIPEEKINTILTVYYDAIGAVVGSLLAGPLGTIIGGALGSIAFVIWGWQEDFPLE